MNVACNLFRKMKKILIVEDDSFLAHAYNAKLTKAGYEIRIARNGVEALEVIEGFAPNLVLLDLVMPIMDGFEVLQNLKEKDLLKTAPVVVASNLGQDEDIKKAMSLGATDFIVKSNLSLAELIVKIESFLK